VLEEVIEEEARDDGENDVLLKREVGLVAANLDIGADVGSCRALQANSKISCPGVKLHGSGFIVNSSESEKLGLGTIAGIEEHIRGYRNGKDLTNRPRNVKVIDLLGLNEAQVCEKYPSLYQHLLTHVKPERDQNNRDTYRLNWWIFGEPRRDFRPALAGLPRYIATVETSKHRFFTFLDQEILPDNMLIAIASDDSFHLGVVSSAAQVVWALTTGGRLGMGNDPRYNKSRCFDPFPFPALEEGELKTRIRELGERLDAHRKARQAAYPDLTLTGMYNVLEKLRAEEPLTEKEKKIHGEGLVTVLKQIHDDLDAAVFEAYGWGDLAIKTQDSETQDARQEELLTRLVALNHERAAEEKRGLIRWLRPEYQRGGDLRSPTPTEETPNLPGTEEPLSQSKINNQQPAIVNQIPWPPGLAAQVAEIQKLLPATGANAMAISACFGKRSKPREAQITEILETLRSLGKLE
jgi:hypothetical protein